MASVIARQYFLKRAIEFTEATRFRDWRVRIADFAQEIADDRCGLVAASGPIRAALIWRAVDSE